MRDQERQRRRRHAVDAAGLADGARADRRELLLGLVGKPRQLRVVERLRQFEAFVAAVRGDVGGLAREIDVVQRVDLELLGDLRRELAEARPDARELRHADARMRYELERAAPLTILV